MSLRTFERLEHDGEGPPKVPIRGRIYYRLVDLEAWVESLRVTPESTP